MILTDLNLLIYAYNKGDVRYTRAKEWFERLMNGTVPVAFCWETINGFIRISTNKAAMPEPYSLPEAFAIVRNWLETPIAVMLEPTLNHLDVLQQVSYDANAVGGLYSDAVLVAYAIANNATIASSDRNFRLFDGLKLFNPLSEN